MNAITRQLLAAELAVTLYISGLTDRMRSDDRGQASTEYAGILFVIVALIGIVVAAMTTEIGDAIRTKIVEAINNVGG